MLEAFKMQTGSDLKDLLSDAVLKNKTENNSIGLNSYEATLLESYFKKGLLSSSLQLGDCIEGFGTDEKGIFQTLMNMRREEIVLAVKEYGKTLPKRSMLHNMWTKIYSSDWNPFSLLSSEKGEYKKHEDLKLLGEDFPKRNLITDLRAELDALDLAYVNILLEGSDRPEGLKLKQLDDFVKKVRGESPLVKTFKGYVSWLAGPHAKKIVDYFTRDGERAERDLDRLKRYFKDCLLYTSPSPRDATLSRMPSSA